MVPICRLEEVPEGTIRQGTLPSGRKLAIYNVAGHIHVTDDVCSHGEASLSEDGTLDGPYVECSWHNGRFDVRNGAPCAMPCSQPIDIFESAVENGQIMVNPEARPGADAP